MSDQLTKHTRKLILSTIGDIDGQILTIKRSIRKPRTDPETSPAQYWEIKISFLEFEKQALTDMLIENRPLDLYTDII